MKKLFIIIGVILILPILAFGFYFFDSVYYQAMSNKAEKAAISYLENKYDEQFKVEKVHYSHIFGEKEGWYDIYVHPTSNPEISFRLNSSKDYKIDNDDYKEMKWRSEAINLYIGKITPLYANISNFYVNPFFSEEIKEKYSINDSYQLIIKENPKQSSEYFHLLMFEERSLFQQENELKKILQLWEIIQARPLKEYTIELQYFPNELLEKFKSSSDSHQFESDNWREKLYLCRLTSFDIQKNPISSYEDLAKFCRK